MPWSSSNPSTMPMIGKDSSPVNIIPYLPDDLLLNCLARVSRLYYPILSLVSKRFCSLLTSPELYKTRTLLGSTESCLYVCLQSPHSSKPHWFALSRGPTRTPNPSSRWFIPCFSPFRIPRNRARTSSSGNLLVSVAAHNFGPMRRWISATVGSDIYIMVGGYTNHEPWARVLFFMDCRSHTWHKSPSMLVAKKKPLMNVVDGKIYVVETSTNCDFSNVIEVFDPKTQIWEHVLSPTCAEIRGTYIEKSFVFEGNFYLLLRDEFLRDKNVVYKPKENKWDVVGVGFKMLMARLFYSCVIDNVLYFWYPDSSFMLKWYDYEGGSWRDLKGLEELHKLPKLGFCCVSYGSKIVLLWEENVSSSGFTKKKMVWCAEIVLETHNGQEILGKVMWCDVVLTVPKSYPLKQLLVATI
ncbi:putative F-box/kelch-repeat protein [Cardamine amara subsp. amara]|uniref:F-box/kelch-repeat protein n=1 Tax=Cardamine amara subsp. amara TaxID=228776 RepID=A0ABD1AAA4_CARAN